MNEPMDYPALLASLSEKDRTTLTRQLQAYETRLGMASAQRWCEFAGALAGLAPARPRFAGANALQFYIPDGKYRRQVFALQVLADGSWDVYAPDVLDQAVELGLLSRHGRDEDASTYYRNASADVFMIDRMDGKTPAPDALYKDMTGWNRRAVRIKLPTNARDAQLVTTRELCALAAKQWR